MAPCGTMDHLGWPGTTTRPQLPNHPGSPGRTTSSTHNTVLCARPTSFRSNDLAQSPGLSQVHLVLQASRGARARAPPHTSGRGSGPGAGWAPLSHTAVTGQARGIQQTTSRPETQQGSLGSLTRAQRGRGTGGLCSPTQHWPSHDLCSSSGPVQPHPTRLYATPLAVYTAV